MAMSLFERLTAHAETLGKAERRGGMVLFDNGCEFVFVYQERKKQLVENHIIMRCQHLGGHMLGAHDDEEFIKDVMTAWYRRVERARQC